MARQRGASYEKQTQSADPGPGGYGPGDLTGGAFSDTNCAKQTQFAFEQNQGQVLGGTGVMVTCTCKGSWKNKPNCPKRGTEAMSGCAGRDEAKGTWNEGQMRKTKPIWTRCPETDAPADLAPQPGIDRAKRSQFPPAGTRPGDGGSPLTPLLSRSIAPNKPNFGSGKRRGKYLAGKELW